MKEIIDEQLKDIKSVGVLLTSDQEQYIRHCLTETFLYGEVNGLKNLKIEKIGEK
jgi:hypothetical protein